MSKKIQARNIRTRTNALMGDLVSECKRTRYNTQTELYKTLREHARSVSRLEVNGSQAVSEALVKIAAELVAQFENEEQ